jgi:hypothetical protein
MHLSGGRPAKAEWVRAQTDFASETTHRCSRFFAIPLQRLAVLAHEVPRPDIAGLDFHLAVENRARLGDRPTPRPIQRIAHARSSQAFHAPLTCFARVSLHLGFSRRVLRTWFPCTFSPDSSRKHNLQAFLATGSRDSGRDLYSGAREKFCCCTLSRFTLSSFTLSSFTRGLRSRVALRRILRRTFSCTFLSTLRRSHFACLTRPPSFTLFSRR